MDRSRKYKIVPDTEFEGMYRIQYPDGVLSEDFYNKTRAKEHASVLDERKRRTASR
jgi:hypothetical protein